MIAANATELTVADVAEQSGVAGSAVRFYERQGLIDATRTAGNQRRFTADAPCRIKVARVAQRVGLTVREIRDILDDLGETPSIDDWARLHRSLVLEAQRRIAELDDALAELGSGRKLCEL